MKSFLLMLTFLTRIPYPINFEFKQEDFIKGIKFFPLIGGLVGALLMPLYYWSEAFPSFILPFIVIVWYLILVGGLHIDGVADVFDGIFSARKPEKILVIMEDSRVGTFGVIGLILYFMGMYFGLYDLLEHERAVIILGFMPVVGRCMGIVTSGVSSYAKKEGMGKAIVDCMKPHHAIISGAFLLILGFIIGMEVSLAVLITIAIILFMVRRIHILLGGITGDVVGAMVEISQVIFLVSLSIVLYNV